MDAPATLLDLRDTEAGQGEVVANFTPTGVADVDMIAEAAGIATSEAAAVQISDSEDSDDGGTDTKTRTVDVLYTGDAADQVFSIPELLENILERVSQIDLFVLQRVSRTFNDTIHGSPTLQRKLKSAPSGMPLRSLRHWKTPPTRYPNASTCLLMGLTLHGSFKPHGGGSHSLHGELTYSAFGDKGQRIGWQGKRAIYTSGSWETICLSPEGLSMNVGFWYATSKACRNIAAGGTLSDLTAFLGRSRVKAAAKLEEIAAKRRAAFAEEVQAARQR